MSETLAKLRKDFTKNYNKLLDSLTEEQEKLLVISEKSESRWRNAVMFGKKK